MLTCPETAQGQSREPKSLKRMELLSILPKIQPEKNKEVKGTQQVT